MSAATAAASGLPADAVASKADERRAIGVASGAHALHDGYTDLIYVMLPIWQAEFGLSYAALGLLRSCFSGTMAGLPDSFFARASCRKSRLNPDLRRTPPWQAMHFLFRIGLTCVLKSISGFGYRSHAAETASEIRMRMVTRFTNRIYAGIYELSHRCTENLNFY